MNQIEYKNYQMEWRKKNKDYIKKCRHQYYLMNKNKAREQSLKWKKNNKKRYKKLMVDWIERNREKLRLYHQEYRKRNKDKLFQIGQRYREKNKNRELLRHRNERQQIKLIALIKYSKNPPECICCGEKELSFLTIDHIRGGGTRHRKNIKTGIYRWLKKMNYPRGYRVLCMNCNFAIGIFGFCPHQNLNLKRRAKNEIIKNK